MSDSWLCKKVRYPWLGGLRREYEVYTRSRHWGFARCELDEVRSTQRRSHGQLTENAVSAGKRSLLPSKIDHVMNGRNGSATCPV